MHNISGGVGRVGENASNTERGGTGAIGGGLGVAGLGASGGGGDAGGGGVAVGHGGTRIAISLAINSAGNGSGKKNSGGAGGKVGSLRKSGDGRGRALDAEAAEEGDDNG